MPAFTTEDLLRLKFQLTNAADVTPELLADAIAEAHDAVTARLDPSIDTDAPPAALVTGETLLAGARALRDLAAREAANQRQLSIGGQRYDTTARHALLRDAANTAEAEAWQCLAPFLVPQSNDTPLHTTDTTPILGPNY